MASAIEKPTPFVFSFVFVFGLVLAPAPTYAQAVSGMREAAGQLKPLLEKEKAEINPEVIWSNGTLAVSPTLRDPAVSFRSETGAIVGAMFLTQPQTRWKLTEKGAYAVKVRRQGADWLLEFLNVAGALVSSIKTQPIEFGGAPSPSPRVYVVPAFLSPTKQPMLLWCWDNFCGSLSP